jgi:hypothetical protein
MTAPAPAKAPPGGQKQAPRPRSFLVGTQNVIEGNDYDTTYTATAAQAGTPWALQATGWLTWFALACHGNWPHSWHSNGRWPVYHFLEYRIGRRQQ